MFSILLSTTLYVIIQKANISLCPVLYDKALKQILAFIGTLLLMMFNNGSHKLMTQMCSPVPYLKSLESY